MKTIIESGNHSIRAVNPHFILVWILVSRALNVSAAPPSISFKPKDQTVILYQQAAFGVIASGTAPLAYQWRKDGTPITGATNDQIVLAQPPFADAGGYSVVVSNAEGSVTSTNAILSVNPPKAGDLDCSFAWGGSINGDVHRVAVQPDGRVLIAGDFTTLHRTMRKGIARLKADGTTDHTFFPSFVTSAWALALQPDGKVLVCGYSNSNGVNRLSIMRLNSDGTPDSGFQNLPLGNNGGVYAIAVQGDGRVLIGGTFTTNDGVSSQALVRLNADGTPDASFNPQVAGTVYSIGLLEDGRILIGSGFSAGNGVSLWGIARLNPDGTLDGGFTNVILEPASGGVSAFTFQPDGKVLIEGFFTAVNGVSRTNLARLNSDGTLDPSFQSELRLDNNGFFSAGFQSDGKILIGGRYLSDGTNSIAVVRLNKDGTLDRDFPSLRFGIYDDWVSSIAVQSDDKVIIGGSFNSLNGVARAKIARLNANGTLDDGFANGHLATASGAFLDGAKPLAVQGDGKLLVDGPFEEINGVVRYGLRRFHPNGTLDTNFHNGLVELGRVTGLFGSSSEGSIDSAVIQNDGKVVIGGYYSQVNGESCTGIARLNPDGSLDASFEDPFGGARSRVTSVALHSHDKVLIAGWSEILNAGRQLILRLKGDGSVDTGFPTVLFEGSAWVSTIAVQSDGTVIVGGDFTNVNGVSRSSIARLNSDGTLNTAFQPRLAGILAGGYWIAPFVNSISLQPDGKVLIGGFFTSVNGVSRSNIARLNADGSLDTDFLNGLSGATQGYRHWVESIALQNDGRILIGGGFRLVNDLFSVGIARLNADGTLNSDFQAELGEDAVNGEGFVNSILLQRDGKAVIGGDFTSVNGLPASGIARLWATADIPPRIDNLTQVGADVNLTWDALPGRSYRVQYKENLAATDWTDLAGDVAGASTGTATKIDAAASGADMRFYRVVLRP